MRTTAAGWINLPILRMLSLYLFNPENDLALAAGIANYTAPVLARKIRSDLQMLPMWVCESPAVLYADDNDVNRGFLLRMKQNFPHLSHVGLWNRTSVPERVMPWGWSPAIAAELARAGVPHLPDEKALQAIRQLSHRGQTVGTFRRLRLPLMPESPVECFSLEEVEAAVRRFSDAVVKAPWSGSGRGVCRVSPDSLSSFRIWIESVIKKQGSIMCERMLDGLQDFAMEFRVSGGDVRFAGYSVFFNNAQMSYDNAMVASTGLLREYLDEKSGDYDFDTLQSQLREALCEIVPDDYEGYIGVDMLLYRWEDGTVGVNPCIEMNVRTTMGVVASVLGDSVVADGKVGTMEVFYHKTKDDLARYLSEKEKPVIADGRLQAGTLLLTPVGDDTLYTATLTIS